MSSINAPYATLHDLPKYEKRADVVGAPWFKDQEAVKCSRGHDPIPYIACNSTTAPFATFHNIPETSEQNTAPLPESPVEQELFVEPQPHPTHRPQFPLEHVHMDTSDHHEHHITQPNMSLVHQAPWDRDDVHYKVQPRFPHGEDAPALHLISRTIRNRLQTLLKELDHGATQLTATKRSLPLRS